MATTASGLATTATAGRADFLEGPQSRRADRLLLVGSILIGGQLMGLLGLALIIVALLVLKKAKASGEPVRPFAVTVFGAMSLIDATTNMIGWSIDTFANSTRVGQAFLNGWGSMIDGGYYVDYNALFLGGTGVAGEKSWQIFAVFALFPLRIAASWAFLKMKRWGYDMMLITSWVYLIFWFGYIANMSIDFQHRMGAASFGVIGFWLLNIWYMTPFLILPWLYALNRRKWCR